MPAVTVDELLRVASVSGFEVMPTNAGIWPKLRHKESGINVDILPEGATPGTSSHPAQTKIPHPSRLGAVGPRLAYVTLQGLIELKLAAARARDESDVVELIRANPDQIELIENHLQQVNSDYVLRFHGLVDLAREQTDR